MDQQIINKFRAYTGLTEKECPDEKIEKLYNDTYLMAKINLDIAVYDFKEAAKASIDQIVDFIKKLYVFKYNIKQ